MSEINNSVTQEQTLAGRFKVSFEIVLVYLATGLILLTFFNDIKVVLFASLGYIALFAFLSVFVVMLSYTFYNIGKSIYLLLK